MKSPPYCALPSMRWGLTAETCRIAWATCLGGGNPHQTAAKASPPSDRQSKEASSHRRRNALKSAVRLSPEDAPSSSSFVAAAPDCPGWIALLNSADMGPFSNGGRGGGGARPVRTRRGRNGAARTLRALPARALSFDWMKEERIRESFWEGARRSRRGKARRQGGTEKRGRTAGDGRG